MNTKKIKLHSFINIVISVNIDQNWPFGISWMIEYERGQTDPNNFDSVIILLLCYTWVSTTKIEVLFCVNIRGFAKFSYA